jgi:adhesin/invasin
MRLALLAGLGALAVVVSGATANAASRACPTSNHPNELVIAGGSLQTAQLGKPFDQSFSVALANTNGCALTGNLANVTVHFYAPGGGASGFFPSTGSSGAYAGTNAQGEATAPSFVANDTAGSYTIIADSDYGEINIPVSNTAAGLAVGVTAVGTTVEQAPIGTLYSAPLQVRVADANGNPVQGASVSFTVVPGADGAGGTFLAAAQGVTTGSDGVATAPPLLANGVAGTFMVTASTDGLSSIATFTLQNVQTYATLSATTTSHVAHVGGRFAPLVVRLVDASGKPVQGAMVSFAVDASQGGPGATFLGGLALATATTDMNGVAASPALVAGKVSGRFTVLASTAAARDPLAFAFRALAGRPTAIVTGAASGESTTVGTRFPVRLAVTVTDADGNVVPGARVTFVAPARGASCRFTRTHSRRVSVKTDANGVAVAPAAVANRRAGGYAVTASAGGKSTAFALTNAARS